MLTQYAEEYEEELEAEIEYLNTVIDVLIRRIEIGDENTCICLDCIEPEIQRMYTIH